MSHHFDYLLTEKTASPGVGIDRLMLMAKTASHRYLKEGTPMNDTIVKFAEDNDLNKDHVERVCEMANMATHRAMWPEAEEKEKIAFPIASPKAVIIRIGGGGGGCGHASPTPPQPPRSIQSDYMGAPCLPDSGPSMADMFGVDPVQSDNGAAAKRLVIILQKKAAEKKSIEADLIVNTMKWESEKKAAYHHVKQEVLGGTSMLDVQDAANAAGFGKIASELLEEFRESLISETHGHIKQALEKVAISPAGEDLISNNLGHVTVANGAHPVLISLDLLHKRDDSIRALMTGLTRVNDELKVYGQRIREMQ